MERFPIVTYYSGSKNRWITPYTNNAQDIVEYAYFNNIEYLVVDTMDFLTYRPELSQLLEKTPENMILLQEFTNEKQQKVLLYKIKIIYHENILFFYLCYMIRKIALYFASYFSWRMTLSSWGYAMEQSFQIIRNEFKATTLGQRFLPQIDRLLPKLSERTTWWNRIQNRWYILGEDISWEQESVLEYLNTAIEQREKVVISYIWAQVYQNSNKKMYLLRLWVYKQQLQEK